MDNASLQKIADSIRCLTIDAIQKANSGHPGLPMGAAELGAYLYGVEMKYDPTDPDWIDRDRFVLSAGHGSMLLYSILHMAGFDLSLDDIKSFRQVGSKCPGHPEHGVTPGVETTTGPLGQGIAMAVGMAMAERTLAAKFNTAETKIFDHYTYALMGDGCQMEGVSSEACSLAGHLGLGKLIAYYDSNSITIDGATSLAFTEDVGARFKAYGWQVFYGNMYDLDGMARLTAEAKAETGKPSLIILTSVIGKGSPNKQGTSGIHGAPLGAEEIAKTKAGLGVPESADFYIAPEAYTYFASHRKNLADRKLAWEKNLAAWTKVHPELAAELADWYSNESSTPLDLPAFKPGDSIATRTASGKCIAAVATSWPNLLGGSADLMTPNATQFPVDASGRYIHFGVREHGMAAIANGIAVHGGLRIFVATFLVFADYLRPAIRLSALMKLPVIYVLTHDSIFVGEDGPTHEPVETLASLRAFPGLTVLRPADAEETAVAWRLAMENTTGPTALILSRQNLPVLPKDDPEWPYSMGLGAYVVRNTPKAPDATLVATGSEVSLALAAADLVNAARPELSVRVVSMPDRNRFFKAPKPVLEAILSPPAKVFVAEAGIAMGWERITEADQIFSIERYGESGPAAQVAEHFGFTPKAFADLILSKF